MLTLNVTRIILRNQKTKKKYFSNKLIKLNLRKRNQSVFRINDKKYRNYYACNRYCYGYY